MMVGVIIALAVCLGGCFSRSPQAPTPAPLVTPTLNPGVPPSPSLVAGDWQATSAGLPGQVGITAIAFAPDAADTVYLATYEPGGLYVSRDAGVTWRQLAPPTADATAVALAVSPADQHHIAAATTHGLFLSTDGGTTWARDPALPVAFFYTVAFGGEIGQGILAGGEATGIWRWALDAGWALDGLAGETILSAQFHVDDRAIAGTAGNGLWLRDTVGWTAVDSLPQGFVSALNTQTGRSYALIDSVLYTASEAEYAWEAIGPEGFEALSLAARDNIIALGGRRDGIAVSRDRGATWSITGAQLPDHGVMAIAITPSGRVLAGTRYNGLWGENDPAWRLVSEEVGAPLVAALAANPTAPEILYAGTLDGLYRWDGVRWSLLTADIGPHFVQALALPPDQRGVIYAGTREGVYVSRDSGLTWTWTTAALGRVAVFALALDRNEPQVVYAGSWGNNILRSTDSGDTWAPIHHGLETLSVHALAVSLTAPDTILAGTVEAIYKTTDRGDTWRALPGPSPNASTLTLTVDPNPPHALYAGTTDGVYRSTDDGETWQACPLPRPLTVNTLATDPGTPGTLYCGTEHAGVWVSRDHGNNWEQLGVALHDASIYALLPDPVGGTLLAGGETGVWRWSLR